jgi:hypothetical protein
MDMSLQDEIDAKKALLKTDSYQMSIGELANLYRDGELDIHPEFQRFYRWTDAQKTRLIESILLGIPIPPIYVAQKPNGVWDVVDGVQRLSTIFQFMGLLKDEQDQQIESLKLEPTEYLPSLGGLYWDNSDGGESFTVTQRLSVKRARIDISIVMRESDQISKYELFQRLNTGGTPLSNQEVRNCILVMINPELFRWLQAISQDEEFRECVGITDKALDERYDMELALRFFIFRNAPSESLSNIGDLGDYLTKETVRIARSNNFDQLTEESAFRSTFGILSRAIGTDAFRRYQLQKARFTGGFLISAFEVVAIGIGHHCNQISVLTNEAICEKIKKLWSNQDFIRGDISSGVRASSRIPKTTPLGREEFKP